MRVRIKVRIAAALAALVLAFSACSGAGSGAPGGSAAAPETSSSSGDEQRIVEVTLEKSFFGELEPEQIREIAEQNGFSECLIAEDGTVTFRMTRARQKEYLRDYAADLERQLQKYVDGEGYVNSFQDITHDEGFTRFDVYVPEEAFSEWDGMYAYMLYGAGAHYQLFSGVRPEEIDVEVNFLDYKTKKLLKSGSYRELLEQAGTALAGTADFQYNQGK